MAEAYIHTPQLYYHTCLLPYSCGTHANVSGVRHVWIHEYWMSDNKDAVADVRQPNEALYEVNYCSTA